jgi:uncharacterized protein involved in tolerance to divalent cations
MADGILLAISTFPDAETATRIARQLVTEKLAACANIGAPVQSIYHWQGKDRGGAGDYVFFKTTAARFGEFKPAAIAASVRGAGDRRAANSRRIADYLRGWRKAAGIRRACSLLSS